MKIYLKYKYSKFIILYYIMENNDKTIFLY